jgi:hypothetical protein
MARKAKNDDADEVLEDLEVEDDLMDEDSEDTQEISFDRNRRDRDWDDIDNLDEYSE